jgi:tight adherence protein B
MDRIRRVGWPVVVAVAGFAVGGPPGAIVIGVGAVVVSAIRRRRALVRISARRDEQLADAVGALVSAIRSGMSVPQAFAYAAEESEPPLAGDLASLVSALEIGVPLRDALSGWADRVGTDDARLIAAALELHRTTGGDLPEVLEQLTTAVRERFTAARELRAMTAQARLSGAILGMLPVGFFAFLWLTSRSEIQGALATPAGLGCVAVGLVLDGLAFLWIRRLLEVG